MPIPTKPANDGTNGLASLGLLEGRYNDGHAAPLSHRHPTPLKEVGKDQVRKLPSW